jgi:hypothetical protein
MTWAPSENRRLRQGRPASVAYLCGDPATLRNFYGPTVRAGHRYREVPSLRLMPNVVVRLAGWPNGETLDPGMVEVVGWARA